MIFRRTKGHTSTIEDYLSPTAIKEYLADNWKVWIVIKHKTKTEYKQICLTKNGKSIKLIRKETNGV